MDLTFAKERISINRELSDLDKLVIRFTKIVDSAKIDYVIISGYITILFGRSRGTEDVDLFIEEMPFEKFSSFWEKVIENGFECINAFSAKDAYYDYLEEKLSIRFAEKGTFIPNFELKFPKTKYNHYSLKNKVAVVINGSEKINTSEIELQIAFKLKLGSDKDFEDAKHLYTIFKEYLNINLLKKQVQELGVVKEAEKVLWKKD